jgi:hypothetical protein
MKWEEAKKFIKSGDLIAVSHQPWASISDIESHIVRIMCESEYSHVAVAYVKDNEPHLIEAIVPEVSINPLTKYLDYGFFWLSMDVPMSKEEESYALAVLGEKYSKLEAVAGFMDLLEVGGDEFWQCSELTISMRKKSGVNLGPRATPAAVVQRALSLGCALKFIEKG